MRNTLKQAFRTRFLAWTLVALLFGTGEVLHLSLIHHDLQDPESPTCSVCKMSEHNLGDLSPAPITGETVEEQPWCLDAPVFSWIQTPDVFDLSPRAPPRG